LNFQGDCYLAFAESNGNSPEVFIYNIGTFDQCIDRCKNNSKLFNPILVSSIKGGNKHGIYKIQFTYDGKYLVILGNELDRGV